MLYRTSKSLPLALVAALWVVPATVRAQDDDLGEPIEVEAGDGGSDEDPPQEPIEVSADEQDGGETTGDADEEAASDTPEEPPEPIDVSIFGDSREVPRVAGSAHRIDEEALERFEDDNIENVLTRSAAGVYVRGEDGYGLRPNIGLRGANSDRSKKVTLMEDGVLLAPAPYSAPAAYYFPLTTRLTAVEVFKGPSAIRFGPNTIGGAVNLVTRRVPGLGHVFCFDLA